MLLDFVTIVIAGLIGGLIARFLRQPLILGYILVGVFVSRYTPGYKIADPDSIMKLADLGVALLLFSLGLEFSVKDLKPIWKVTSFGAGIQVALTLLFGFLLGRVLGWEPLPAFCLGICIISSSTAVIMKSLSGIGQMGTLSSRVMLGMSIVQDLTVIPLMLILLSMHASQIGAGNIGVTSILWPVVVASLFVAFMFVVGGRLIPPLLRFVAKCNSQELFLLCVLTIALGIGYCAELLDLSFSFGAFIAGLVLNSSSYGHKALSELVPLRDVFAMLFFVSVGTLLDPWFVVGNIGTILLVVVVACLGRGLILALMSYGFGYRNVIPLAAFLGMFPISEIGFVVVNNTLKENVIDEKVFSIILNTIILSMIAGPVATGLTTPLYRWYRRLRPIKAVNTRPFEETDLANHVVIAGGGHLGRYIAAVLKKLELPYICIDPIHADFVRSRDAGLLTIFGDPKQEAILETARVSSAKILIETGGALSETRGIVRTARTLHPGLVVIAQSEGNDNVDLLRSEDIDEVVQPENEIGLEMLRQALLALDVSIFETQRYLDYIRTELYSSKVPTLSPEGVLSRLLPSRGLLDIYWILLPEGSSLTGETLAGSRIRELTGATIAAIARGEQLYTNPSSDFRLEAGDSLAAIGTAIQFEKLEALIEGNATVLS